MNITRPIPHFDRIEKAGIEAQFFDGHKHRASLYLPFSGRRTNRTLCVIGQNPSAAGEQNADKTIRYLEELIYRNHPEYTSLLVLNLYSRVDTAKSETVELLNPQCVQVFDKALQAHQDFLLVYGKLRNEGAYKFPDRAIEVAKQLKSKNVFKLGLNTRYPPHPGNPKILYSNYNICLVPLSHDGA